MPLSGCTLHSVGTSIVPRYLAVDWVDWVDWLCGLAVWAGCVDWVGQQPVLVGRVACETTT
jgi:hypothetical protein